MIKKIVIVGGGFSGWYTAAFVSKNFSNIDLTVVDSEKHPRLGVGETFGWSAPYDQKRLLHLENDRMLMWETGAIYKYGIQPINFYNDNSQYAYGKFFNLSTNALSNFFGTYDYHDYNENWNKNDKNIGLLEAWMSINQNTNKRFKDYCQELNDSTIFAKYPYAPYQNGNYVLRPQEGWSYHMDVEKTVLLFRSLSSAKHISSPIVNIKYIDNNVQSLTLENGETVQADLFIDCSGFSRILTKNNPNFHWIDSSDQFNNSACVVSTRYTDPHKQIVGSTSFYGEDWGWRFKIPLYHRQGNGYIFNSNFVDPNEIVDYMKKLFLKDSINPPRVISWSPGYFRQSFVGNTLALGVSGHFVDPFDGPSYDIHSRNLEDFLKYFDEKDVGSFRLNFNKAHETVSEERFMRLVCTFGLSKKTGKYWDTRRELFKNLGYDKKFLEVMNGENNLGNRHTHFWQQMYYRLCVISDYDRTCINSKKLNENDANIAKSFFAYFKSRNRYLKTLTWPNYYEWLKENRFNGQSHSQVLERIG